MAHITRTLYSAIADTRTTREVALYNKKSDIKKGDYVHVVIVTIDDNGRSRDIGGDFFLAFMSSDSLNKSTAGRVVDYGNGTYSVFFYAAWSGEAHVHIELILNREGVLFLKNMLRNKEKLITYKAEYTDGTSTEIRHCALVNEGIWMNQCEYVNQHAMGNTVIICDKPHNFTCDQLQNVTHEVKSMNAAAAAMITDVKYIFERKFVKPQLKGTPIALQIKDLLQSPEILQPCTTDLPVPLSDGYWKDRTGDIVVKFKTGVLETDLLDRIVQSNCSTTNHVIVLNFAYHYGAFTNRAFLERIYQAKLAVQRLMLRCPTTKIVIKLAHPRDNAFIEQTIHSANWVFYDINRMIRRVFGGIGIHFLDIWDMVLSSFKKYTVHMPDTVIVQEVHLMLSYICPELVVSN
ncbi:NXPE family member 1-like [Saccoglossus kowalevskii]